MKLGTQGRSAITKLQGNKFAFLYLLPAISITIGLAFYYLLPLERSIFTNIQTQFVRVTLVKQVDWFFVNATVCKPVELRRSRDKSVPSKTGKSRECGQAKKLASGAIRLEIPAGTGLEVTQLGSGKFQVMFARVDTEKLPAAINDTANTSQQLQVGSRILAPSSALRQVGGLEFRGTFIAGKPVTGGFNPMTLSGDYELRERLPLRERPEIVKIGQLQAGDVVAIIDKNKELVVSEGFMAPAMKSSDRGFNLVATAANSDVGLKLQLVRH